jgi:hypothetical protein
LEVHIKLQLQFDFNEKKAVHIKRPTREQAVQGFNRLTFLGRNGVILFAEGRTGKLSLGSCLNLSRKKDIIGLICLKNKNFGGQF